MERYRDRRGQADAGSRFNAYILILAVIVSIPVVCVGKEVLRIARRDACLSHQKKIDDAIATYETNSAGLPSHLEIVIQFNVRGKIQKVSAGQPGQQVQRKGRRKGRAAFSLPEGSDDLTHETITDELTFVCPDKANQYRSYSDLVKKVPDAVHYIWISSPRRRSEVEGTATGGSRGAYCYHYWNAGPDGTPSTAHSKFKGASW
jgi:hypothetical protein